MVLMGNTVFNDGYGMIMAILWDSTTSSKYGDTMGIGLAFSGLLITTAPFGVTGKIVSYRESSPNGRSLTASAIEDIFRCVAIFGASESLLIFTLW